MEAKEILEYLGVTDADSLDKFKSSFEGKFITRANAHEDEAIAGKISAPILGGLTTEAKRLFGFKTEEIKEKNFQEIFKMGVERLSGKIKTLEESQTNDEKYTKLKGEYDALDGKYKQTDADVLKLRTELDTEKANAANSIKQFKIDHEFTNATAKLPFADGTIDYTKKGFYGDFRSKYKMDLDPDGKTIVVTDKDGKRVANPKRTGEYLGLEQVLELELNATEGLAKKNPASGPVKFPVTRQAPTNSGETNNERKAHPRAIAQVDLLK